MAILISKNIENFLQKKLDPNENFSQSMLFWGQPQISKLSAAKHFAKSVLCKNNTWGGCNSCANCNYFDNSWHPDLMVIDSKENIIKKKDIEEAQNFLMFKPMFSQKRILIINEAEKLNYETQSALLKSLEEPKNYFIIILITASPQRLLKTVKSRLLSIHFLKPKAENLANFLTTNFSISQTKANELATLSLGHTEKAIQFIQNPSLLKDKKENEAFFKNLTQKSFFEQTLVLEQIIKKIEKLDAQEKSNDSLEVDPDPIVEEKGKPTKIVNKYLKNLINDWLEYIEQNLNDTITKEAQSNLTIKQQQKFLKNTIRLLFYIDHYNLNKKLLLDNFCLKTF